MDKTKTLIIATITILTLILFVMVYFFNPFKQTSQEKPVHTSSDTKLISFSENFIKDYTTYDYKKTAEYNNKMLKYISPNYSDVFRKKYLLPEEDKVDASLKNITSIYSSSNITVLSKSQISSTVNIQYKSIEKNGLYKNKTFPVERAVTLVVKKNGDSFFITSFTFSVTD